MKAKKIIETGPWNVSIIDRTNYYHNGDGEDSDEPYSYRGTDVTEHHIDGFDLVPEKGYGDLLVDFKPTYDKTYFLVYVIYSTGDSFSHSEGKIQFIELCQKESFANKIRGFILSDRDNPKREDKFSLPLVTESGKNYTLHMGWKGYFERLTSVEVQAIRLHSFKK